MYKTANIAFLIYRLWAYKIYLKLKKKFKNINFIIIFPKNAEFKVYNKKNKIKIEPNNHVRINKVLNKYNVKLVLCYGWSWIIPKKIHENFICVGLHPSKLPNFKGGSPIQNQIIKGIKSTYISVFRINKDIDGGGIFQQRKVNISVSLKKIFSQLTKVGFYISKDLLEKFINGNLKFKKQKKYNKVYKRRTPKESLFDLKKVKKITFAKFNNFVRALNDPYPNAYFCLNKKAYKVNSIKKINKNRKIICLNRKKTISKNIKGNYIELKDSFAKILDGKVKKNI